MAESKKDKAVKTADMDYKKKTKTQKESDLSDTEGDLKGTEKELYYVFSNSEALILF